MTDDSPEFVRHSLMQITNYCFIACSKVVVLTLSGKHSFSFICFIHRDVNRVENPSRSLTTVTQTENHQVQDKLFPVWFLLLSMSSEV